MPKHRRRKNQRKNKGNNNNNKGNKQAGKRQSAEEELVKSNEVTTGIDPEIETVDDIKSECTQTIERSFSVGRSEDESKIADDKLNGSDTGKTVLVSEQFENNFGNFSDSCRVTESLEDANSDQTNKTGAKSSTEQKAGEPSPPSPRELVEIRKNNDGHSGETCLHNSPTSSSLSSSDSDTLKADEDSPDREVPNVLEIESQNMHDVTDEGTVKDNYVVNIVDEMTTDSSGEVYKSVEECKNATSSSSLEGFEDSVSEKLLRPVKHPIIQEVITTLYSYRVESPKPMKPKTVKMSSIKKSRSLDDDDVMIQEISDNSSAGDLTDNQPIVSEAESEADSSEALDMSEKNDPRILSITTIPLDSPEAEDIKTQEFVSSKEAEAQDLKSRRAKKRAALETHFLPQFLNPRYLDSIKEECSDISDVEKKSDSEILSHPGSPSVKDLEDDVFADSTTVVKKANAVFPKSNLDFSHKHKPVSHLRPPKTGVIREEPPCVVVEAKIVEQESIEESCSTWTTEKIQESGAAEIVYLDSASSSSSDLLELDYTQGNDADIEDLNEETDVHIETPTIDVDGENVFIGSAELASEDQKNKSPSENEEKLSPSLTPVVREKQVAEEIIENSTESCDHRRIYEQSASDHHVVIKEKLVENNPDEVLSEKQLNRSVDLENSNINYSSNSECNQVKTDFKIGEPCSNNMFASLLSPLISSDKETANNVNNDNLEGTQDSNSSSKELARQDSSGSHGSGQSQSTVHSQCTAINKDSLTHTDVADIADIASCVSGSSNVVSSLEPSSDTAPFKTLRQLCIEVLASMPYGKDVLEELASVAESLSTLTQQHQERKLPKDTDDMPYPIPDLPRIEDLEVPVHDTKSVKLSQVKLMSVPPTKPKSPVPPPIPELPKESSWLGVPTEQDPNVLVCLSPSQRSYLKETKTFTDKSADTLLDMHKKFVERRGYHELTAEQVNAMQREKSEQVVSSTQLRNSVTPPPIPPPPLPQSFIENDTVTTSIADDDDKNNHRLLAIIRDSKQSSSENISRKIEQPEKSESVSVPKTQRSDQETQTTKTSTTTTTTTPTFNGGEKLSRGKQGEDNKMPQQHLNKEDFFKTWDHENPFKTDFKRFSSIETTPTYCGQLMQTIPKRYSNIETSSYESRKRIEDGKVVYEFCDSNKEKFTDSSNKEKGEIGNASRIDNSTIMSEVKLKPIFRSTEAPTSQKSEFSQSFKNSKSDNEKITSTKDFSYDEFRQRAKETAKNAKSEFFKREKLLKDFEDIEKIFNDDLFSITSEKQKKESKTYEIPVKYQSKTDMWEELDKKIQQQEQKEEKKDKRVYENWDFKTGSKVGGCDKSKQTFQQEQKEKSSIHEIPIKIENRSDPWHEFDRKIQEQRQQREDRKEGKTYKIPIQVEKKTDPWEEFDRLRRQHQQQEQQKEQKKEARTYDIPVQIEKKTDPWEQLDKKISQQQEQQKEQKKEARTYEIPVQIEKKTDPWEQLDKKISQQQKTHSEKVVNIPVRVESKKGNSSTGEKSDQLRHSQRSEERVIPVKVEEKPRPASATHVDHYSTSAFHDQKLSEKRLSSQNLDEWLKYANLGASSENITKPFMKEMEIVYQGKRANVKAPRLTASTSNLHTAGKYDDNLREYDTHKTSSGRQRYMSCHSMIDQTPITQYVTPHYVRRSSLPKELHDSQVDYIKQKEHELQSEFDRLEHDRRRIIEELDRMHTNHKLRKDLYQHRSCRLPTLSEEEAFRQQMHDEWMSKVAEREERRLHKIIKISKPGDDLGSGAAPERPVRKSSSSINISDEFLKRVKERRSKLQMPSDSDWESGAESQPAPSNVKPDTPDTDPSVKVIEGQKEADLKQLPKHLREFAELTSKFQEEHTEESSFKKSTMMKKDGVWSPASTTETTTTVKQSKSERTSQNPPTPPPPPVWSPQPSPPPGRKEFRPVRFESPVLPRRYVRQESAPVAPPWSYTDNRPFSGYQSSSCSNLNSVGTEKRTFSSTSDIPQKFKDTSYGKGASYTETERPKIPKDDTPAFIRPNEVIYSVKHEYMSEPESEHDRPKKMAQLGRRQFEGIGPTTKDGMPIVLRSEVKENNQHQWYKRMYNTLHKAKDGDEYVTIRYKTHRGRYPYKSNGYMSEPEPSYDSDYITMKYNTLDRRRTPSTGTYDERNYGTMPNPVKSGSGSYKNQPGRIEDYVPGRSSVSEKEKKEWWDEVMDIFNGHLEQQKLSNNYAEGYLSRALKEQGYESDSNLVFRKKDESQFAPLSPVEQKQAYRSVQAGGEPPLQGFRKPAPEKPKESPHRYFETDVNIHYKTPVRYEYKEAIPEEELARRQAETMKKLYQEEKRRKYLQELQDMNSRRHTDNFTPTQKSPIPLNRYDDFNADISPKSPSSSTYPKTVARALYNFQGQTARELTFKKGDVIYIRRQIDKNWYEGEHNAMIGLLPANYVEIISKDGVRQPPKKPSEGQARAKFNFQAQSAIELSLNKGELVTLTRRVDENWFEGKIANRKGIFPVSYVEVLTDIGAEDYSPTQSKPVGAPASHSLITYPNIPSHDTLRTNLNNEFNNIIGGQPTNGVLKETKSVQKTEVLHVDTNSEPIAYRALYKYRPQNNDELELQEGDIVYVLEKCDDGWYVGTSQRTGYFGTFPGNYVERV